MPITFTTVITENPITKLIEVSHETPAAPDATPSEIQYAKAFAMMTATFKEKLQAPEHQPKPKFRKSYGRGVVPPKDGEALN